MERRVRRLAAWAGGAGWGGRERVARLAGAAALLALEQPAHAREALRPPARLSHQDARDLLARRYPHPLILPAILIITPFIVYHQSIA